MEPWYKVVSPRKEVREGRSFNPDEFAIALEQVVAGKGPEDYVDPGKFFLRTCFTKALNEYAGMVLRRMAGETANTAPVLTLITQFGGGKTHTLTVLYHLARTGSKATELPGIARLVKAAGISDVPRARVGIFVGNAWDPQDGRETPWIDIARQLAGDQGVALLGSKARSVPPGTDSLGRLFDAAGGTVLILFDEVLNFVNRHRELAEPFHAFIQNLTVAMTGMTSGAAVISLPRSQVEMTDWDIQWQEKITKVVRRVAKDLIANDETEISEVVCRRLFEGAADERIMKRVCKAFADWCFERRAQLPFEWTAVDTTATEKKAREFLQARFEACYPFHPATLSVFQRKWQILPQYQQTRGTLAMLAQWISWAYRDGFTRARREPLITLGSAPLEVREFQSVVLGQLGETKLGTALDADISGAHSIARALDADTKGVLRDVHRRVGAAILFESSGGQIDKAAHLPELRFALGEPELDTTSIDNAALALESKAYYIRRIGSDGFRIHHQATLRKVKNDKLASLDENKETRPELKKLVKAEFERGRTIPAIYFADGPDIQDSPKLTIIVMEPEAEWTGDETQRKQVAEWMKQRGATPRPFPASLLWCFKKCGRELRQKVEDLLAWKHVKRDIDEGRLAGGFDRDEQENPQLKVRNSEQEARDEVWASYRYLVLADQQEPDGLEVIDLGAGHSSAAETLCGRVISALKSQALLNETVGAGYIQRSWPEAFKESGAWPLSSLRQSFLNGALTRLLEPDVVLRSKIFEFVARGEFGLASGKRPEGGYQKLWFKESFSADEIEFDANVFLLTKQRAESLRTPIKPEPVIRPPGGEESNTLPLTGVPGPHPIDRPDELGPKPEPETRKVTLRVMGTIPPELWNRLGTRLIPKLRSGEELKVNVDFSVTLQEAIADSLKSELNQILNEMGLQGQIKLEKK